MKKIIGYFKNLEIVCYARNSEGKLREIHPGDQVFAGEIVVDMNGNLVPDALRAVREKDSISENRFKHLIEITPFYRFVQKQKDESKFITIEKSQLEFINEFNLSFVVVRKDAEIPSYIVEIQKEIIIDNKSGDRFILLK